MTKVQAKGEAKNQAIFQGLPVTFMTMVVLEKPEPIVVRPKAKRRLNNSKLRNSAVEG